MEKSGNLYLLIKSLTKSEKGYFKKYASFHIRSSEGSNYIKIFNAIDAQLVYDEHKLIKKFKQERFINQFSVAKNYLYNIILESLEAYHYSNNKEIRSLLNKIELLTDRGLYVQAKKLLKKVRKMAEDHKLSGYISEIDILEQSILRLQYDMENLKEVVESLKKGTKNEKSSKR